MNLRGEGDPTQVEIIPLGNLDSYISSRRFLDVGGQGVKGWVKAQIFKVIRFYAWWQEHINRAFYEALTRQQTKIAEVERGMQETFQQKVSELVGELTARDQMLEEINQRLTALTQNAGKWGQDLQNLKGEWIESQKAFQQILMGKMELIANDFLERDRLLAEANRNQIEERAGALRRELSEQNVKVGAIQNELLELGKARERIQKEVEQYWLETAQSLQQAMEDRDKEFGDLKRQIGTFRQNEETIKREMARQKTEEAQIIDSITVRLEETKRDFGQVVQVFGKDLALLSQTKIDSQGLDPLRQEMQAIVRQLRGHKQSITDQQRRLAILLEEARKRLPEKMDREQLEKMEAERDHLLDTLYVGFEDQFRGTREDIKERLKEYLPLVRQNAIGTEEYPILDLGCGRGEWLELLKEEGRTALGVDRNRVMVDLCRERNLEAAEGDALDYLRKAKANSLGAVTGFQFAEHIPPHTLVAILDECLRVLRSRGLIIFETPNPENLFVGAYSFYIDPTHRNPLVPDSLNFLAQQRGFVETKILRLHKYGDFNSVDENADEFQKKWFYSETDFALIGYKP